MECQESERDRQQRRHETREPRGKYDGAKHERSNCLCLQQSRHKLRSNNCNSNRQDRHDVSADPRRGAADEVSRCWIPEMGGLDTYHLQARPAAPAKAIRALWMTIGNLFRTGRL